MTKASSPSPETGAGVVRDCSRQRLVVLLGLLAVALLLCWLQARTMASTSDAYEVAQRQLEQMRTDARQVLALREAPRSAVSRTRPNEELLGQIERSLAAANIDRDRWHDSVPQPASRLPKSNYKRLTTRVYFQEVTLKELAAFCHHLQQTDPTIQVSALSLTNRSADTDPYDAELAVSYLVYEPRGIGGPKTPE